MRNTLRARTRRLGVAGLIASLAATAVPLLGTATPAAADVITTSTVTASTGAPVVNTNVAPGGTLSGLVDGQVVNLHVSAPTAADLNGIIDARQCDAGVTITDSASMIPNNTGFCMDAPFAGSAGQNTTGNIPKAAPGDSFVDFTFKVGTGSEVVAYDDGAPHTNTITCGASSPSCTLWIEISTASGSDFVHYDLAFAGTPGAPTGVTATCTAAGAKVDWTAPANTGNAALSKYTVTLTPTDGGAAVAPVVVTGAPPATTATIGGLTLFKHYDVVVTAANPASTSAASTPTVTYTACEATAPTLAAAQVADQAADLSWTFGGAAPAGYRVTITQQTPTVGAPQTFDVTSGSTFHASGLVNGETYVASVQAAYGMPFANFSLPSNQITFAPISTLITQTITVRRPAGALVLTQVCTEDGTTTAHAPTLGQTSTPDPLYAGDANTSGYPYPQDLATGDSLASYPTSCGITLAPGRLITSGPQAGQFFQSSGKINQVTVVDTRDASPNGWTVTGTMGDFVDLANPTHTFSGSQLGWTPKVTDDSDAVTFSDGSTYDQDATEGAVVAPNTPAAAGLSAGSTLASTPVNARLGIAKLDADLLLWIPITARTGDYTGVLTITAV